MKYYYMLFLEFTLETFYKVNKGIYKNYRLFDSLIQNAQYMQLERDRKNDSWVWERKGRKWKWL